MTRPPRPPFEALVLGFGVAIAVAAYVYWTAVGASRGDAWSSVPASRALVVLGGTLVLALVLRMALWVDTRGQDDGPPEPPRA